MLMAVINNRKYMKKLNQKGFSGIEILLVVVVVGLIGTVGWLVYDRQQSNNNEESTTSADTTTTGPTQQLEDSTEKENVDEKNATNETSQITSNIDALLDKGEYLKLEPYMAAKVTVIKQSTDGNGTVSGAAAVKSISNYLTKSDMSLGADLPWDFDGHEADRAKIKKSKGIISDYTDQNHIGISQNDWVVAYNLNDDLKIESFYISLVPPDQI